jgi:hypothetical protein
MRVTIRKSRPKKRIGDLEEIAVVDLVDRDAAAIGDGARGDDLRVGTRSSSGSSSGRGSAFTSWCGRWTAGGRILGSGIGSDGQDRQGNYSKVLLHRSGGWLTTM